MRSVQRGSECGPSKGVRLPSVQRGKSTARQKGYESRPPTSSMKRRGLTQANNSLYESSPVSQPSVSFWAVFDDLLPFRPWIFDAALFATMLSNGAPNSTGGNPSKQPPKSFGGDTHTRKTWGREPQKKKGLHFMSRIVPSPTVSMQQRGSLKAVKIRSTHLAPHAQDLVNDPPPAPLLGARHSSRVVIKATKRASIPQAP